MEAIALLCTLHADGPATLVRLRGSGCHGLEQVESLPLDELASLLRGSPKRAQRFQLEARLLRERLAEQEDEPGTGDDAVVATPARGVEEPAPASAERRPVVAQLLERWREEDRLDPPRPAPEPAFGPESDDDAANAAGLPLAEARIDGLGVSARARLDAACIATVEELTDAEPFALSRRTGIAYTQLLRLQFLARRVVGERPDPAPADAASGPFA